MFGFPKMKKFKLVFNNRNYFLFSYANAKICFFSFILQSLYAQNDSSYKQFYLPEVSIVEQKWELDDVGHEKLALDTIKQKFFLNQRISDWLETEGLFYIKNYGLGQLNTLSYRGNTANQSQILWNGVPIQSPFNATADFAQIPIQTMKVSFLRGANPALWGSGAGSTLMLSPQWNSKTKVHLLQQLGSFGLNQQHLFVYPKWKNHFLQLQFYRLFAHNDFAYINREKYLSPKEKLVHAQTLNYGLQMNYKTFLKKHFLEFHFWAHHSNIQIPPVLTADTSAQNQLDKNLRFQFVYQTFIKKIKFSTQQTFLNDYLYYEDSIANIFSKYWSNQWFSDYFLQYANNKHFLQIQFQSHWIFPKAENSMNLPPLWQRLGFIGTYQYQSKNNQWKYSATIRQESVQNQWIHPIIQVAGNGNFYKFWYFKANLGNTYRFPSLNDLYWQIGGNPLLKPENGFQYEVSLGFQKPVFQAQMTYYSGKYDNLIIWLPEGSIWKAQNLNQTHNQGIEFWSKVHFSIKKHQFITEGSGFYGESILTKERFPGDDAYRKQLIYQPLYRWSVHISWNYQNFFLQYQQIGNSFVYYTTDNSEWLPDFYLGNLIGTYSFRLFHHHEIHWSLQIKNVWNEEYQIIKNRPMPGRHFLMGIQWKWT